MPGFPDFTSSGLMNALVGRGTFSLPTQLWLAMFSTAPTSDIDTTGGAEVSVSGCARAMLANRFTANLRADSDHVEA